jgi:hypothetical protein
MSLPCIMSFKGVLLETDRKCNNFNVLFNIMYCAMNVYGLRKIMDLRGPGRRWKHVIMRQTCVYIDANVSAAGVQTVSREKPTTSRSHWPYTRY